MGALGALGAVGVVLLFAGLGFAAWCAFRESRVTGLYKAFGVYGRIKAYLALDFTMAGAVMAITTAGAMFIGDGEISVAVGILTILLGLVITALGVVLYWSAYLKCPAPIKKGCVFNMIVSGLGISMKLAIFFLFFVWRLTAPETATLADGTEVYVFPDGEVYNPSTGKIGRRTGINTVEFPVN